jgi:glycosyltransferase involved in cell wall biosynthesis
LLFFGNIASYKGLEYAVAALDRLNRTDRGYRLVIAGQIKGCQPYWEEVDRLIDRLGLRDQIVARIEYIPDEHVEMFFKAADVLVLPYKFIYQSGVLFLSYSFGLPVIATDIGSLSEDVVEGKTGMICRPCDPDDLATKLDRYFDSDLFRNLELSRQSIADYGNRTYSWDTVGEIACALYSNLCRLNRDMRG